MKRWTDHLRVCASGVVALVLVSCGDRSAEDIERGGPPPVDLSNVEGCVLGEFDPYWGVLHAHTSYSDGTLTPADAFAYGRDQGGLDILVITDHLEQLYLPIPVDNKWERCRQQADEAYAPGSFVADCGFEYGSGFQGFFQSTGHNNVFFSGYLFPAIQLDFHRFYESLVACPTCIGQFNHPGDPTNINWNGFEYHADVDQKMNLFEFNSADAWDLYFQALDAGWHVSPMNNQDNHDADWGTRNGDRSGLYLSELTREALKEAMEQRRSFMSTDRNAAIRATAWGRCWMGSILSGELPPEISIVVEAFDLDPGDRVAAIELYGPGQTSLGSAGCPGLETCRAVFRVDSSTAAYVVARAVEEDGDLLTAAPIWIERE